MVTLERHRARLGVKREGVHGVGVQNDITDVWVTDNVATDMTKFCKSVELLDDGGGDSPSRRTVMFWLVMCSGDGDEND